MMPSTVGNIDEFLQLPLEERRNLLKQLLRETVPKGAVKEVAFAAGLSDYTLYKCRDPECESHNLIRPELLHILHLRQDFRLLHFLCELFNHIAVPRPRAADSLEEVSRQITRVFRECAAACEAVINAVEPPSHGGIEITWEEFHRIRVEIRAAQRQLGALEEAARRKSAQHPSWPVRLAAKLGLNRPGRGDGA